LALLGTSEREEMAVVLGRLASTDGSSSPAKGDEGVPKEKTL